MQIQPMLAESVSDPSLIDWGNWIAELKLDGVRCIAYLDSETRLQARSGAEITHKFPELQAIHLWARKPMIVDGEIVSADLSFEGIQRRVHKEKPLDIRIASKQYPVIYWVFDILAIAGDDLTKRPLIERKAILADNVDGDCSIRYLPHSLNGTALYEQVKKLGLEGIMAKRMKSRYQQGKRSPDWQKIKNFTEAEFWICGLTKGDGSRENTFGSLILAKKTDDGLAYVGNVGSGFTDEILRPVVQILQGLKDECPFSETPDVDRKVLFWTKPTVKVEVRYLHYEADKLRFPTFRKLVSK